MNRKPQARRVRVVLAVCAAIALSNIQAVPLYWDGDGSGSVGGGSGTWNTALSRWSLTPAGSSYQAWNNGAGDDAVFQNSAGTVELGTVTASSVAFNTDGYLLHTGSLTLNVGTIDVSTGTTTINSVIAGTGFTKIGAGSLILGTGNSFTGPVNLNAGTILISAADQLGGAANTLNINGGTLRITALHTDTGRTINIGASGGTIENGSTTTNHRITGPVNLDSSTLTLGSTTAVIMQMNGIHGAGTVLKTGIGQVNILGPSTWAGTLLINQGTFLNSFGNFLPDTGTIIINNNGALNGQNSPDKVGDVYLNHGFLTGGASGVFTVDSLTVGNGTINAIVQGSGTLTKNTTAQMRLTKAALYTGDTFLNDGTILIQTTNSQVGAIPNSRLVIADVSTAILNIGTFTTSIGALEGGGSTGGSVIMGVGANSGTLTTGGKGIDSTFHGVISGNGTLIKTGLGKQTFTGQNTYTGQTRVNAGVIELDHTGSNASKINGDLQLNGGGISVLGNAAADTTATFDGLNMGPGASTASATSSAGRITTIDFTGSGGVVTRAAGSSIDFTLNNNGGTARIKVAGTPNALLGTWATINGSDFASLDANNFVTPYTGYTNQNNELLWAAGQDISNTAAYFNTTNSLSINSLRFNAAAASTVTINAGQTLTIDSGAILNTVAVGANASAISGGNLSTTGNDLLVMQNNPAANMTISSNITTGNGVTKAGAGTLILSGANTYGGSTTVAEGTLVGDFGSVRNNIHIGGGTLILNQNSAVDTASQLSGTGMLIKNGTGRIKFQNGHPNFNGEVILNQGTLAMGAGDSAGTNKVTVNNATLEFDAAFTTPSGAILAPNLVLNDGAAIVSTVNSGTATYGKVGALSVQSGATITLEDLHTNLQNFTGQGLTLSTYLLNEAGSTARPTVNIKGASNDHSFVRLVNNSSGGFRGHFNIMSGNLVIQSGSGLTNSDANGSVAGGQITLAGGNLIIRSTDTPGTYAGGGAAPIPVIVTGAGGAIIQEQINNGVRAETGGATHTLGALEMQSGELEIRINPTGTIGDSNSYILVDTPYGWNFSTLALNGDGTFSTVNNGTGTATLSVGPLSDTTGNTLTTVGDGVVAFTSGAAGVTNGTKLDVAGGTVNLNAVDSLGTLTEVNVAGAATLNVNADNTAGVLTGSGSVNIGANILTIGGANNLNGTYAGNINGSGALVKNGGGEQILDSANAYSGATTVNGGRLVIGAVGATGTGNVTVESGGTLALKPGLAPAYTFEDGSLTINAGGRLDITNSAAILEYSGGSPLATVRSQIQSGYNNGAWDGDGIVTTAALAADFNETGVAYYEGVVSSVFEGTTVDSPSIVMKYAYLGDANGDGTVDSMDYTAFVGNYGETGTFWVDGDFNYDGKNNTLDFNLLAGNFGKTIPLPAALSGTVLGSAVPEPSAAALLLGGLLGIAARRRR